VVAKRNEGKTYRQIARETGVSPAQAQRIYEQWNINRKIHNAQRTGRPRKVSARDLRQAKRVVGKMPFATLDKVAEESHAPVKPRVLGRYLRNEGWYCRRARKKTWLNPTTRRKRYRWCLLRKKWDVMQWRKVVYCDEKILGPGHSGKSKVVRRPPRCRNRLSDSISAGNISLREILCPRRCWNNLWSTHSIGCLPQKDSR
jgi:transposase